MTNRSGGRNRPLRTGSARPSGTPAFQEPEVRRWPHPVDGSQMPSGRQAAQVTIDGQIEAGLYYIHCTLSYQNQLLADIKALLEQLAADHSHEEK